ncbi:MAG TPA: fumarylacetoacetate hydrolase family protein [Stenomitos sp.]
MIKKFARFEQGGLESWGLVEGDKLLVLAGDPLFGEFRTTDHTVPLSEVRLLAPAKPPKILAVGLNYRSHLQGRPGPDKPELFFKPPSALVGPGADIVLPPDSEDVHYEGELVIVMGRRCRNVSPEQALDYVFGYTLGNDVSERRWQAGDRQWWRAKGCDTFAPVGPWIVQGLDVSAQTLRTRLNGEVVQEAPLTDLIFDVPTVVSFASRYLTLEQGDLIFTGTPGHTRAMHPGDVVEVEVSGIGTLRNPVRNA